MKITAARFAAFSLVALVTLTGCPRHIPPPENLLEEPQQLRAAIDARIAEIESARFKEIVVDYFGEGERVKVRQLILVEQPSYLRVQTRAPGTDEIMSLLVSDGETFAMHRRDSNTYYRGDATPENIARLLPVDLSARDVTRIMLGGAPWDRFDAQGTAADLSWDGRKGKYRYATQTRRGGELVMWVRPTDYAVEEVVQMQDDKTVYRYTTDDWKRHGSVALPGWRRFVWPERNLDFSMDVGETQIDVELPDILFELPPPAGSKIIHVDS